MTAYELDKRLFDPDAGPGGRDRGLYVTMTVLVVCYVLGLPLYYATKRLPEKIFN